MRGEYSRFEDVRPQEKLVVVGDGTSWSIALRDEPLDDAGKVNTQVLKKKIV